MSRRRAGWRRRTSHPKSEPAREAGQEVQRRIGDAGDGARPESRLQFVARVFETEREQQQEHTDVGTLWR